MCGRFTLTIDTVSALAALLGVVVDPRVSARYRPRWNVAPTQSSPLVLAEPGHAPRLTEARWGIDWPSERARAGPQILARAETLTQPARLPSLARRRCLVPADGFYEWAGPKGDRRPFWFHAQGGGLLLFAGIHQRGPEGESFAIVTTAANDVVAKVHDRMPAVLSPAQAQLWLEGDDVTVAAKQLRPAPRELLVARAVSKRVSDVSHDDPACLAPIDAGDAGEPTDARAAGSPKRPKGQLKLF